MAKLSAHGFELGRIEFLTSVKAYMSDGKVLKNCGHGWKLAAKVKPGVTPQIAYERAMTSHRQYAAERPSYERFKGVLHAAAPLADGRRWHLLDAISLMPGDPDGVWAELDEHSHSYGLSLDEISELCAAYRTYKEECKAMREHHLQEVVA